MRNESKEQEVELIKRKEWKKKKTKGNMKFTQNVVNTKPSTFIVFKDEIS